MTSFRQWLGGKMPKFVQREYLGYQFALRDYSTQRNPKRVKGLWKVNPHYWPYTNGDDLSFDLWFVPTKNAISNAQIRYKWTLLNPNRTHEYGSSSGIVRLSQKQATKETLNLGHFSLTGQYRLEVVLSSDSVPPSPIYIVDFKVRDWDSVNWTLIQLIFNSIVAAIVAAAVSILLNNH